MTLSMLFLLVVLEPFEVETSQDSVSICCGLGSTALCAWAVPHCSLPSSQGNFSSRAGET